jgi:sugar lactone lactonase YvrE
MDGTSGNARFSAPFGIALDDSGNVFVADTLNNIIRKITVGGIVTTLAGASGSPGSADGAGAKVRFRNPWGVAVDAAGNVFVADMSNNTIRKIAPDGTVTTIAGHAGTSGSADGVGSAASFNGPFAVAVDNAGNLYVSDSGNNTIRKISPGGSVVTLAGLPGYSGSTDGSGSDARFWNPQGLVVDDEGNILVADTGNNLIRKISPSGNVTTLPASAINAGAKTNATVQLNNPGGIGVDSAGDIYVADTGNHCIRKLPFRKQ